ncbi:protein of unknown function (plasmid) [Cupriavidus taiwanensis]|uniref:Uncharacterized protein n=1 Tax=Cupriavidus taiwanensis TaxID=164546 RepID=A0A375IQ49_9BURK|nr:hypothetical protein CBM2629_B10080 [Cupriavidus taiwanensis]SPK76813.1 protein of unknown function [Cupriavidus taiwanensis]
MRERVGVRAGASTKYPLSQLPAPALTPAPLPLAGEGSKPSGRWLRRTSRSPSLSPLY